MGSMGQVGIRGASMSEADYFLAHRWSFCDHCDGPMVLCGKCGNNTCNGGYGEVLGVLCDACPSAYDLMKNGTPPPLSLEEARRVYLADPTRLNLAALAVIFESAPDSVETAGKQEA
jgi:hypothetical protein